MTKRQYTREEEHYRRTRVYLYIAIIVWAIFMIVVIFGPVKDKFSVEETYAVETPTATPQVIIPEPEPEPEPVSDPEPVYEINRTDVEMLARLAWGEARGCTTTEQAAVMWCVLNRVDSDNPDFRNTIAEVITQPHQFYYSTSFPLEDKLVLLAEDVLLRWYIEKDTGEIDGRVLPKEYCWFGGDGRHNHFRDAYKRQGANIWDWSLDSPYEDD